MADTSHSRFFSLWGKGSQSGSGPERERKRTHRRNSSSFAKWFVGLQISGKGGDVTSESPKGETYGEGIILNHDEDADIARFTSDLLDDGYTYGPSLSGKLTSLLQETPKGEVHDDKEHRGKSSPRDMWEAPTAWSYSDTAPSLGLERTSWHNQMVPASERKSPYKGIWQSITKRTVSKTAIDSLKEVVMSLKPRRQSFQQSDALRKQLLALDNDSRALAALMKDLHKNGGSIQASLLFDFVRSVPEEDELYSLADLYTYTTAISHCGSNQKLQKALGLFSEMKSRGIKCNIHAYSALMSVCVKHNDCSLAIEKYQEMIHSGCQPNLVTFNILIDAYNKLGLLNLSVKALEEIKNHKLLPEARTYNSIISACGKACRGGMAIEIYQMMIADGVGPTNTTYTSAIAACGRSGMVDEALLMYRSMPTMGCQPNVITFSSLISVCERAGNYPLAKSLFKEMNDMGVEPNIVTYNGMLGTFAKNGKWEDVLSLLQEMEYKKCKLDSISYSAIVAALSKAHQWKKALEFSEEAQAMRFKLEQGAFTSLLGCMWSSGRISVQKKAIRMFSNAQESGNIKIKFNDSHESTLVADMPSVCCLALIKWVLDYRQDLRSASTHSNPLRTLIISPGKYCGPADSTEACVSAMTSLSQSFGLPVRVHQNTRGYAIKTDVRLIGTWMTSPSAYLLRSLCDIEKGANQHAQALIKEHMNVFTHCQKAYSVVKEFENGEAMYMDDVLQILAQNDDSRRQILDQIVQISTNLKLKESICHDAVQLCNKLLVLGATSAKPPPAACAAALILIICRHEACPNMVLKNSSILSESHHLKMSDVLEAETCIMSALGSSAQALSPIRVLAIYFDLLGYDQQVQRNNCIDCVITNASGLVSIAAVDASFASTPPSIIAAACLCTSLKRIGMPSWPTILQDLTGYDPENDPHVNKCFLSMQMMTFE